MVIPVSNQTAPAVPSEKELRAGVSSLEKCRIIFENRYNAQNQQTPYFQKPQNFHAIALGAKPGKQAKGRELR
ncbi:MAG: hypothetical protein LBS89_02165 [Zoogloeaceae bacterium]|jgi:hypothetical protein|nr:hypothetical protein [Zoogloeaceae bacterium]